MIRVMLWMDVPAACAAEFERAWRDVAAVARRAAGNLRQDLLRDPRDPSSFVITSDWTSRDAFERFEKSPEQDALVAPLVRLRESVRMTTYDIVAQVEGCGE